MQDKEMPLGTAIPVAAQRKILHKQYTRNLARIKDYYCKLYVNTRIYSVDIMPYCADRLLHWLYFVNAVLLRKCKCGRR